jgi:hypothetical protein
VQKSEFESQTLHLSIIRVKSLTAKLFDQKIKINKEMVVWSIGEIDRVLAQLAGHYIIYAESGFELRLSNLSTLKGK